MSKDIVKYQGPFSTLRTRVVKISRVRVAHSLGGRNRLQGEWDVEYLPKKWLALPWQWEHYGSYPNEDEARAAADRLYMDGQVEVRYRIQEKRL